MAVVFGVLAVVRGPVALAGLSILFAANIAQAIPVTLVSGHTVAVVAGSLTTIPFTSGDVAAASDGSLATAVVHQPL